jgi:hypothetical protein
MKNSIQKETLSSYVASLEENFNLLRGRFQQTYLAAEQLYDLFIQLYTERVSAQKDVLWEREAVKMLFGAFSSWVQAFAMTSAGLGELGLTAIRRAIEFTCYTAKIKGSNDRADLWLCRNEDADTRKRFSREFGVPRTYFDDKYAHLRDLLVWHEHASDFGVHGNFSTLVTKERNYGNSAALVMSFQDDPKNVPIYTGNTLMIGRLIINAILLDLRELIRDPDEFRKRVGTFNEMLRMSRIEIADYRFNGAVPAEILGAINSGEYTALSPYFEDLKRAYLN